MRGGMAFRCDFYCPSLGGKGEAGSASLETHSVMVEGRGQLGVTSIPRWCAECKGDHVRLSTQGHCEEEQGVSFSRTSVALGQAWSCSWHICLP